MGSISIPAPRSVRSAILCAFGVMIVILGLLIGGAVVTVKHYQSATDQMQVRANIASKLQDAEANGSVAALLLQRYVVSGDAYLVPEIQLSSQATVEALTKAASLESAAAPTQSGTLTTMEEMSTSSATLVGNGQQVIQLVQTGQTAEAGRAIERVVPTFRDFRLQLITMANQELAEVSRLQATANSAGSTAMTLIIVSGIIGSIIALIVAFFVSHAIIRPLSKLEDTAQSVALGDMNARAPVGGPRELKRLAESLNLMTATARQRTEELRLSNEELRERNRQLLNARYQAATDPLTGLLNHRTFHEQIREAVADRLQHGGEVALIMVDIDNFKRVNDSLGHMAGDHVLREIGATITDIVGERQAFRYGGDEFAILLADKSRSEAISTADRLLKAVKTRVRTEDTTRASISLGVATFPEMAASAEELLYRADMALNWAKSRGKSRVGGWDQVAEDNVVFTKPQLSVVRGTHN